MSEKAISLTGGNSISIMEDDVIEGMRELQAYIDLTPHDFQQLYEKVYGHARKRILKKTLVKDIMASPALSIKKTETLEKLIIFLAQHQLSGAPVVDDNECLVGVVSEKDILKEIAGNPCANLMQLVADSLETPIILDAATRSKQVQEIMTTPPINVVPEATLGEIAMIFENKSIKRLPVTDASQKLMGIVTRANIVKVVSRLL